MTRTFYIHIGFAKTGTTTIQSGLALNRAALMDGGYYVPVAGAAKETGKITLRVLGRSLERFTADAEQLFAEFERVPAHHVIISHEKFRLMSKNRIRAIWNLLPADAEAVIVVYLRRQDRHLQSIWSQLVKSMSTDLSFEDFVDKITAKRNLDYHKMLDRWASVFGAHRIRVRLFDEVIGQGDLFHDFLATCDIPNPSQFHSPPRKNESPSIKSLEVIRWVSIDATQQDDQPLPHSVRQSLSRHLYKQMDCLGWNDTKPQLLTPQLQQRIFNRYAKSNAAVAQKYLNRDHLFAQSFTDDPVTPFDIHNDVAINDLMHLTTALAIYGMGQAKQNLESEAMQHELQRKSEKKQRQLRQEAAAAQRELRERINVLEGQVDALSAEVKLRKSMPLARIGELLHAAGREWRAQGWGGLIARVARWLRGERRHRN